MPAFVYEWYGKEHFLDNTSNILVDFRIIFNYGAVLYNEPLFP